MAKKQQTGATFNIGNQQGNITNIGGDQNVYGDQHANAVIGAMLEVRNQLRLVRDAFERLPLADDVSKQAGAELRESEAEASIASPEPARVAARIERFTVILKAAGALAAAGLGLLTPLQAIAVALGPAGRGLLGMLRR